MSVNDKYELFAWLRDYCWHQLVENITFGPRLIKNLTYLMLTFTVQGYIILFGLKHHFYV